MLYDNYAMLTKRELLIRLVTLLKENNLVDGVRYIPVEMRPRDKKNSCCVHKDRYIIRHKIISILGFDIRNEEDIDLVPLSHYAQKSLDNKNMKGISSPWCTKRATPACSRSTSLPTCAAAAKPVRA